MISRLVMVLGLVAMTAAVGRAEHATIDLRVFRHDPATGKVIGQASSYADTDPPVGGVNPRPVLKVKAGEPLVLQFVFINTYPHNEIKNVSVHYFVVEEAKIGQKPVPDLERGTITEGRFRLNFKPKTRVGARAAFSIPKAGIYLLRVQTHDTQSDHEHFSAIDLHVE